MSKLTKIGENLNAYIFSFDTKLFDSITDSYFKTVESYLREASNLNLLEGGKKIVNKKVREDGHEYFLASYEALPLLWFSSNNQITYSLFLDFFNALDISNEVFGLVDCDKKVQMYCGFFVVGDRFPSPAWHVDYSEGGNAFTLITPLFEPYPEHGGLLYQISENEVGKYEYKYGEAIFFGEGFAHSTEPYDQSDQLRVMVSLTFGTDKMEHWDQLKQTIGAQSEYVILPNGEKYVR